MECSGAEHFWIRTKHFWRGNLSFSEGTEDGIFLEVVFSGDEGAIAKADGLPFAE